MFDKSLEFLPCLPNLITHQATCQRFAGTHDLGGKPRLGIPTIPEMKKVLEPGEFKVMIGASAEDIRLDGSFEIRPLQKD